MEHSPKKARFFLDFRDFITVRTTFGGLVAVFTAFLPLLNNAFQVLPLKEYGVDNGVFDILMPTWITVITTTITLVAVLSIFAMRDSFCGIGKRDARRKALISVSISIAMLTLYIVAYQLYYEYTYFSLSVVHHSLQQLYFEVPLLIIYATFFSHLTQASMLLAIIKFYKKVKCDA
ncbi:hypothetical protein EST62_08825 [Chlorobaculum sp. 24CR]|uniref:hypothetical protein n=1 Tax=Chlorobaculum sp. 24CR TaxID=2508878 RepID=UPI0010273355|nr:hypothetical protein [Chlorobaculum sp. 24CR]RXK84785.1 hypothetical protein EST62_08825 [Chlorobaculum sp. 24CR]